MFSSILKSRILVAPVTSILFCCIFDTLVLLKRWMIWPKVVDNRMLSSQPPNFIPFPLIHKQAIQKCIHGIQMMYIKTVPQKTLPSAVVIHYCAWYKVFCGTDINICSQSQLMSSIVPEVFCWYVDSSKDKADHWYFKSTKN